MIKISDISNDLNISKDFGSDYIAPEIQNNQISYKCDIYSIGLVIYYIINEYNYNSQNAKTGLFKALTSIQYIFTECTNINPEKRPSISELMIEFYTSFQFHINESSIKNLSIVKFFKGIFDYNEFYIRNNISLTIDYLSFVAEKNNLKAQQILGLMYSDGRYIKPDFEKAIYYLSLGEDKNDGYCCYLLSYIYIKFKKKINKGLQYLSQASRLNFTAANVVLGYIYSEGHGVPKDKNKAIYYLTLAAEKNNIEAYYYLGRTYYFESDINKTIFYFTYAANNNHLEAQRSLGIIYSDNMFIERDIKKSIYYLTLAANQNHIPSQNILGYIYSQDKFQIRDMDKAIYYFTLAANNNDSEAQKNLGIIYSEGILVKRDFNKAFYYLSLAANQNEKDALNKLGMIYCSGYDVPYDINKSIYYFTLAANQNSSFGQMSLGIIFYKFFSKQYINKAIYYLKLAANKKKYALYALGLIYYHGRKITQDVNKAIFYFEEAAKQNDPGSLNYLGAIYHQGIYVKQNINKAIEYYSRAAKQNNVESLKNLGNMYYIGKYVKKDIKKSIYYYTIAANKNDSDAQFMLYIIYTEGLYKKQSNKYLDLEKGINYLILSAKQNNQEAQYSLVSSVLSIFDYDFESVSIENNDLNINNALYYLYLLSKNGYIKAYFILAYFYHEGKYIYGDINKAISLYKEASSYNNNFAKNNLGIIYKNGFGNEIPKNLNVAIAYLNENVNRFNDKISMYNLASIYIYEENSKEKIDDSIKLLIRSVNEVFEPSYNLLCIIN